MALEIFKLVGSIMVDNSEANESISKTDEKAEGLGNTLINGVGKAVQFGTAVLGASASAGAGMFALAQQTSQTADAIAKASSRMNVDYESYQKLNYAMGQSGVQVSTLEKASKKLEGTGLNIDDALDQIMSLGTEAERSAMAAELFGDTIAYELSPVLAQSGEEFQSLQQNAEDLGLIMSEDAVEAGVMLGDTLSDVQQSFSAMVAQLGSAVIPIVQQVLELVIDNLPTIQGIVDSLVPVLVNLAQTIMPALMDFGNVFIGIVQTLTPIIAEILQILTPIVMDVLMTLIDLLSPLLNLLSPLINLLMALLEPMLSLLDVILPPLVTILEAFINVLVDDLNTAITFITGVIETYLNPVFEGITDVIDTVKDLVLGAWEDISDGIGGFVEAIGDGVETGFNALIDFVKTPVNAIIGFINTLIEGINSISIDVPDWVEEVAGISSIGFNIPTIPMLAKGGHVVGGGSAIVGEAGAELIDLPSGATVTPLTNNDNLIDYEKMAEVFTNAITSILPELQYSIEPNGKGIFDVVRGESAKYKKKTGRDAFA